MVKLEIPLGAVEPLFNALHTIKPMQVSRLEMKAIGLLKSELYFELEKLMENEAAAIARKEKTKEYYAMEREKRKKRIQDQQEKFKAES